MQLFHNLPAANSGSLDSTFKEMANRTLHPPIGTQIVTAFKIGLNKKVYASSVTLIFSAIHCVTVNKTAC